MIDRGYGAWLRGPVLPGVLVGATLVIGGESAALPLIKAVPPATAQLMVEDGAGPSPAASQDGTYTGEGGPLAQLIEALVAAQAKLQQLDRAAAALADAAGVRAELATKEEENRRLRAELQTLRAHRVEWQRADDAAKAEIAGLGQALDEATADAKKLDGELAAVRWQNAQLSTSLNRTRAAQESAEAKTETVRSELSARIDQLTENAKASGNENQRLNEELASATRSRDKIAARVAELQQVADDANSELEGVRGQLGATAERLNEVNEALTVAEQERDAAQGELDQQQARADLLSGKLAVAEADLEQARAARHELEMRMAGLEHAATAATDAARQNLLAVESRIAALNSALAKVDTGAPAGAPTAVPADAGAGEAPTVDGGLEPTEIAPAAQENGPDRDAQQAALAQAPSAGPAQPAEGELALINLSEPAQRASSRSLAELTADLPVVGRIQAQSLLADLQAETEPQGVKLTVPGGELFTVNGQDVRPTAHDSLAKVAELINLYKSQPVLIIGHTDAIGASDYNKTLSERRASLVRQFFIDNFDVAAGRLSTQGMGEQRPIASNATAAGRRANRRVEVLILN